MRPETTEDDTPERSRKLLWVLVGLVATAEKL
jgi:hypothetical protein